MAAQRETSLHPQEHGAKRKDTYQNRIQFLPNSSAAQDVGYSFFQRGGYQLLQSNGTKIQLGFRHGSDSSRIGARFSGRRIPSFALGMTVKNNCHPESSTKTLRIDCVRDLGPTETTTSVANLAELQPARYRSLPDLRLRNPLEISKPLTVSWKKIEELPPRMRFVGGVEAPPQQAGPGTQNYDGREVAPLGSANFGSSGFNVPDGFRRDGRLKRVSSIAVLSRTQW